MKVNGISFSSDKKLARCEQQYSYRYDEELALKQKKVGLFRGDLGHQLVQAHYTTHEWRKKFDELKATRWDNLFDEEKEDYGLDFMEILYDLMEHYEDHWENSDRRWKVICCEQDFKIMTKFGFPVRWKVDLVVEEEIPVSTIRRIKGHGEKRNILVEHKFKKKIPSAEERILQPQVHAYAWLLGKKGIPINTILWDYVRTEPVPRPHINKDGSLSVRRIHTDQRGYLRSLREAEIEPRTPDEIKGLQNKLESLPETLALERVQNSVNLRMGEQFVKDWVERALRAKKISRPLRNWNYNCKFDCDYFLICQTDMRQDVDRNLVILKNYEKAKGKDDDRDTRSIRGER